MPDGLLEVGRITKPHGLRGDVVVFLVTDRTERLDAGTELQTDRGPLVVQASRPHQDRWVVDFDAIGDRETAEQWRGVVLSAPPVDDADVVFVHQLVGASVELADGTVVGTCTAVVDNPAHDLLELDGGQLVPMVFVTDVDPGRRVEIDPPEGLLDLT